MASWFLSALGGDKVTIPEGHSGRLELAQWMTKADHPLTARVISNPALMAKPIAAIVISRLMLKVRLISSARTPERAIGQAVITTDPSGVIVYWNDAAEQLYGYRSDEMLGRDLSQLAPNREEYDALAIQFTVNFEQSPPAWTDGGDLGGDPRRGGAALCTARTGSSLSWVDCSLRPTTSPVM